MLKDILQEREISIYQLSKQTDISYSTLNDIVNNKISIENCRVIVLYKLSKALNLSMDELYSSCSNVIHIYIKENNIHGIITVKNKRYQLDFEYKNIPVHITLEKVNTITSFYINDIARWEIEDFVSEKEMEESWNEIYFNAKR